MKIQLKIFKYDNDCSSFRKKIYLIELIPGSTFTGGNGTGNGTKGNEINMPSVLSLTDFIDPLSRNAYSYPFKQD